MINPKQRAELEQAQAMLVETLPPLWRGLYLNSVKEGFTKVQALELVKTFILSSASGGVNGS
jgi:hypothetical protein